LKDGDIIFRTPEREFLRYTGDGRVLVEGVEVQGPRATAIMEALRRWLGIAIVQLPGHPVGNALGGGVLGGVQLDEPKGSDTTFQSGRGFPGSTTGDVHALPADGGDVIFTKPEPDVITQLADLAELVVAPAAAPLPGGAALVAHE